MECLVYLSITLSLVSIFISMRSTKFEDKIIKSVLQLVGHNLKFFKKTIEEKVSKLEAEINQRVILKAPPETKGQNMTKETALALECARLRDELEKKEIEILKLQKEVWYLKFQDGTPFPEHKKENRNPEASAPIS